MNVVIGIIQRNQHVLVSERASHQPYGGYWEFPGGKIEKGETAFNALQRELQEELGINEIVAVPWFAYEHSYSDQTVYLHVYQVSHFNQEPYGKENQILRWVSLLEIRQINMLAGNSVILDKLSSL